MRRKFVETIIELAEKDKEMLLLAIDVGYGVLEPFIEKFPDKFINVGIGEQNAVSMATGLALKGKIPIVYSINSFLIFRALEQIRMLGSMNQKVILVGVGLDKEYTNQGISHYSNGDENILKLLPNLKIFTPKTKEDVKKIVKKAYQEKGPSYIRLSRY